MSQSQSSTLSSTPSLDLDIDLGFLSDSDSDSDQGNIKDFTEGVTNSFQVRLKEIFITSAHSVISAQEALDGLKKLYTDLKLEIRFIMVVEEKHLDGSPHLHAHVKIVGQKQPKINNIRFDKIFKKHVDIRKVRSTRASIIYLQKSGTPVIFGMTLEELVDTFVKKKTAGIFSEVASKIVENSEIDLLDDYPGFVLQNKRKIDDFKELIVSKKHKVFQAPVQIPNKNWLYGWQLKAMQVLLEQNDRHILWVYDYVGNVGKSELSKYLESNYDAFCYGAGKWSDIAHAYNYQQFVAFDYSRDYEEKIPYGLFEQFKNGRILSGKYSSTVKKRNGIKLIIFANFKPDLIKMSLDRWQLLYVEGKTKWTLEEVQDDSTMLAVKECTSNLQELYCNDSLEDSIYE